MSSEPKGEQFKTLQSVCGFLRVLTGILALAGLGAAVLAGIIGDGLGVLWGIAGIASAAFLFVQVEIARVLIAIERNTRRAKSPRILREE